MDKTKSKKPIIIALIAVVAVILSLVITAVSLLVVFVDNRTLDFEEFFIGSGDSDIRIIHLSDLHFPNVVDTDNMLDRIEEEQPDIIAITGDLIGTRTAIRTSGVSEFIQRLATVAPVFFVSGNHENRNPESYILYAMLVESGVYILNNRSVTLNLGGVYVALVGLDYGTRYTATLPDYVENNFVILLTHEPVFGNILITVSGISITPGLILAGHIHGGQIRIFGRGLLSPDTLVFPRYSSGLYTSGETDMIVSRGIGNSIVPWRFNNRPHIPIINISF